MKKILTILMLVFTIFSCGQNPEKNVNYFLKNIKEYNINEAKKYVSNPELLDTLDFKFKNDSQKIFFEALFKNLEYEVQNVTTREDKTKVVNVKITNVDVEKVFNMAYRNIFQKTFSGEKNIDISKEFKDILNSDNIPKKIIISQFLIDAESKDGKIIIRKENLDNIFGSYFSILANIRERG